MLPVTAKAALPIPLLADNCRHARIAQVCELIRPTSLSCTGAPAIRHRRGGSDKSRCRATPPCIKPTFSAPPNHSEPLCFADVLQPFGQMAERESLRRFVRVLSGSMRGDARMAMVASDPESEPLPVPVEEQPDPQARPCAGNADGRSCKPAAAKSTRRRPYQAPAIVLDWSVCGVPGVYLWQRKRPLYQGEGVAVSWNGYGLPSPYLWQSRWSRPESESMPTDWSGRGLPCDMGRSPGLLGYIGSAAKRIGRFCAAVFRR